MDAVKLEGEWQHLRARHRAAGAAFCPQRLLRQLLLEPFCRACLPATPSGSPLCNTISKNYTTPQVAAPRASRRRAPLWSLALRSWATSASRRSRSACWVSAHWLGAGYAQLIEVGMQVNAQFQLLA